MFCFPDNTKIIFLSKPVNLLKGIDGLTAVAQNELHIELNDLTYVLFCNAKKNMFKILFKDGDNLSIWFKRFDGTLTFTYDGSVAFFSKDDFYKFIGNTRSRRHRGLGKII